MKKQLLLYLFIVSVLFNVFTYMYFSKKEAATQKKYESLDVKYKDSIQVFNNKLLDADYFSLEKNDRAQNYLADYDVSKLAPSLSEALLEFNSDPQGNKYVDQPMMGEQKFIINKIKIINHRWIVADYSNGTLWGEVLIKYFVESDTKFTFETIETYLYSSEFN
jgi:hypothetical protein